MSDKKSIAAVGLRQQIETGKDVHIPSLGITVNGRDILQAEYEKVPGVEYDINKRWQEGIPHHPNSIELMNRISNIDFVWMDDYFCWKTGGDGDNGEAMMYLMDIAFEEKDKKIN